MWTILLIIIVILTILIYFLFLTKFGGNKYSTDGFIENVINKKNSYNDLVYDYNDMLINIMDYPNKRELYALNTIIAQKGDLSINLQCYNHIFKTNKLSLSNDEYFDCATMFKELIDTKIDLHEIYSDNVKILSYKLFDWFETVNLDDANINNYIFLIQTMHILKSGKRQMEILRKINVENKIYVQGPRYMQKYKNIIINDKEYNITIFGEFHNKDDFMFNKNNYDPVEKNMYNIFSYCKQIKNRCVDLFVEEGKNIEHLYDSKSDYISKLNNIVNSNYNYRKHHIDIRMKGKEKSQNITLIADKNINEEWVRALDFSRIVEIIINFAVNNDKYLIDFAENPIMKERLKEIQEQLQKEYKKCTIDINVLKKVILISCQKTLLTINIYSTFMNYFMDLYTLFRMFVIKYVDDKMGRQYFRFCDDQNYPKNIIIYVGLAHAYVYNLFLLKSGFTPIESYENNDDFTEKIKNPEYYNQNDNYVLINED